MAKSTLSTKGSVYFLLADDCNRLKIGFTIQLKVRVRELELSSPISLTLIKHIFGTYQVEVAILAIWAKYRLHGEWFKAHPDLLKFIRSLRQGETYSPEKLFSK